MASDKEIDQCLAALETVYPNHFKSWTSLEQLRTARQVYHRVWRDIDGQLLEAATLQWLSTKRPFHPSPGELRDLALSMIDTGNPSGEEAWLEVMKAMHDIGSHRLPTWSNARLEATVKAFNWKDLCATSNEDMPTVRAQFMRIYEAQRTRQRDENLMLPEVQEVIKRLAYAKRIPSLSEPRLNDGGNDERIR